MIEVMKMNVFEKKIGGDTGMSNAIEYRTRYILKGEGAQRRWLEVWFVPPEYLRQIIQMNHNQTIQ